MKAVWPEAGSSLAQRITDYVSNAIYGCTGKFPPATILGVFDQEQLAAGVLYYDYERDAGVIQISAAASTPRWLTRPVLFEIFDFPFNQLECQAVVMRVSPDHHRLLRILKSYGFEQHTVPHLRGRGKADVLCILTDNAWRQNGFHKGKN